MDVIDLILKTKCYRMKNINNPEIYWFLKYCRCCYILIMVDSFYYRPAPLSKWDGPFGPFHPAFSTKCIIKHVKSAKNVKWSYEKLFWKLLQFLSTNSTKWPIWPLILRKLMKKCVPQIPYFETTK